MALRTVLDQPQAVLARDSGKGGQISRLAIDMHWQNSCGPTGRRLLQYTCEFSGGHRIVTGLDVDQHRRGASPFDRRNRGHRRVGYGEDEVARSDATGAQSQLDGIRSIRAADGLRDAGGCRKRGFKGLDLAVQNVKSTLENPAYRGVNRSPLREVAGPWVGLTNGDARVVRCHAITTHSSQNDCGSIRVSGVSPRSDRY